MVSSGQRASRLVLVLLSNCVYMCMYAYACACVYVCVCANVHVSVSVRVLVSIHTLHFTLHFARVPARSCDTFCLRLRVQELNMFLPEGRGKCLPFPGQKLALRCFRNYLVVVHKNKMGTDTSDSYAAAVPRVCSVTVCDPTNNFIAYEATFDDVRHVLFEWSSIFVLTTQGKVRPRTGQGGD